MNMTQEQINVDLLDEVKRLASELRTANDQAAAANKGARINARVNELLAGNNKALRDFCERAKAICLEDDDPGETDNWLEDYNVFLYNTQMRDRHPQQPSPKKETL